MKRTSDDDLEKLARIADIILDPADDFFELKKAFHDLKNLFLSVSGLDLEDQNIVDNIYLDNGKAIGTKWAAFCIDDILRTKRFLRGVHKAIKDVQKNKREQPIHILYAGTGPFATLVTPLITRYSPSEVQFHLLEVNSLSFGYLKRTFTGFDAMGYVHEFQMCDATDVTLKNSQQIDIVVIECLQHALEKEPQVAITHNLLSQCRNDVLLIPERISLHISLINTRGMIGSDMSKESGQSTDYLDSGDPVFELNKELFRSSEVLHTSRLSFPKVTTTFNEEQFVNKGSLAITTEIYVYGGERLAINESGLTLPLILAHLDPKKNILEVISQYIVGNVPQLSTTIVRKK